MIRKTKETETTVSGIFPQRNIYVKCLLENGRIERHSFKGSPMDTERFIENLEGKVMEIHILSRNAIEDEEEQGAASRNSDSIYRGR